MKLEHIPFFRYPWNGLKEYLESVHADHLPLLTYGSLMNNESASLTVFVDSETSLTPAIGYGIKRVFNYKMPNDGLTRHGPPASPRHIAALNVVSTGDPNDSVNGLLMHISASDIEALRQREIGYNLVPITAESWEQRTAIPEPVFALECPETDETILPHLGYLDVCESGAQSVSAAFLDFFRRTTFLADGIPLTDWSRQHDG